QRSSRDGVQRARGFGPLLPAPPPTPRLGARMRVRDQLLFRPIRTTLLCPPPTPRLGGQGRARRRTPRCPACAPAPDRSYRSRRRAFGSLPLPGLERGEGFKQNDFLG